MVSGPIIAACIGLDFDLKSIMGSSSNLEGGNVETESIEYF
jgi:hypothetical protein